MATSVPDLLARISKARADVARHKLTIRTTRDQLCVAAAALKDLETEARRLGIAIINQPEGVGDIHGRQEHPRSNHRR
jgi:hypothetical protein